MDDQSGSENAPKGGRPIGTADGGETILDRVIAQSLNLLFRERQEDLVDEMVKIAKQLFPIQSAIIMIRREKEDIFDTVAVIGYPENRAQEIKEKISYTWEEIEKGLDTSRPLGRFSRYFPAELYADINDKDILETLNQDEIRSKRRGEGAWHPLDRSSFCFIDRSGNEIGFIYVTSTSDGRLLSQESIDGLDALASLASLAMELSDLREKEQRTLEVQEKRAAQMSQILTMASSILTLTDPSKLLTMILSLIDELFGFKSASIGLYDEAERAFKWVGFSGYSEEQISRAKRRPTPKEVVDRDTRPEYRIGYLAHFKPAEKTTENDLQEYFIFDSAEEAERLMSVPRKSQDAWHPLDDMAFLIQNQTGKTIGVIYIDQPLDGKIPSRETIEMIEVFVSLVAIALENANLYTQTNLARDEVHVLNRLMFHDLMNYSTAIHGFLELALAQSEDASMARYIERSMKQIDQTSELIEKVRKLSAIRSAEKGNMLRIDLARTVASQATKTTNLFSQKKVRFTFSFEKEEAFVMANDLLPDLFHNIFMNAIKFDMHETVQVEVGLREITEGTGDIKGRSWRVSIADHGPGVPEERKKLIFLGTQKLLPHEPARGMGLGLSIVKSLVDLYDGEVWVEDREQGHPERGAVFFVQLPEA